MACAAVVGAGMAAVLSAAPARANVITDISSNIASLSDLVFGDVSHITVGLGPKLAPDYLGSDDYAIKPDLSMNVRFGERFSASARGAELTLFGIRRVTFGPVLHLSGQRGPHVNPAVEGLGRIKRSPELGVFAKALWPDQLSLRLSIRHGLARGHKGTLIDLEGSAEVFRSADEKVKGYLGASTTWTGSRYNRVFFGVSEEQSLNSILPVYYPGNSMRDVSMSATLRWELSESWSLNGSTEYSRLLNRVADSPLVRDYGSPNQFSIGFSLTRTFRLDK